MLFNTSLPLSDDITQNIKMSDQVCVCGGGGGGVHDLHAYLRAWILTSLTPCES